MLFALASLGPHGSYFSDGPFCKTHIPTETTHRHRCSGLCSPADSLGEVARQVGAPTASLPEDSGLLLAGLVRTRNGFANRPTLRSTQFQKAQVQAPELKLRKPALIPTFWNRSTPFSFSGQGVAGNSLVAQRIKRLYSIRHKLKRFPTMRLTQIQDIGGCRAIVSTNEHLT